MLWPIAAPLAIMGIYLLSRIFARQSEGQPLRSEPGLDGREPDVVLLDGYLAESPDPRKPNLADRAFSSGKRDATYPGLPPTPDPLGLSLAIWGLVLDRDYPQLARLASNEAIEALMSRAYTQAGKAPQDGREIVSADTVAIERRGGPALQIRVRYQSGEVSSELTIPKDEIWVMRPADLCHGWILVDVRLSTTLALVKKGG